MEIGVYTFAELRPDPDSCTTISVERRLRDLMEEWSSLRAEVARRATPAAREPAG
jgi:hypothetical protein